MVALLVPTMVGTTKPRGFSLFIPVEPTPASRPRVSQYGTYYSKTYTAWLNAARGSLEGAIKAPLEGPVSLEMEVVCTKPRTGKLLFPKGDVDNYAKGPMDVLTKLNAWGDDSQVVRLLVTKRYAAGAEQAGTLIRAHTLNDQP